MGFRNIAFLLSLRRPVLHRQSGSHGSNRHHYRKSGGLQANPAATRRHRQARPKRRPCQVAASRTDFEEPFRERTRIGSRHRVHLGFLTDLSKPGKSIRRRPRSHIRRQSYRPQKLRQERPRPPVTTHIYLGNHLSFSDNICSSKVSFNK